MRTVLDPSRERPGNSVEIGFCRRSLTRFRARFDPAMPARKSPCLGETDRAA